MDFNAIVTLNQPYATTAEELADEVHTTLADYSPATAADITGRAQIIITLPAANVTQAIATALHIFNDAGYAVTTLGFEVLPTTEYDHRDEVTPIPDLVSVTQAAQTLGVSRQAILQRIETGSLAARRLGNSWALARQNLKPPKHLTKESR